MILQREKFESFTPRPAGDPSETTSVLLALNCGSRADVDDMVASAVKHGGSDNEKTQDIPDFMYGRSFSDPDGNVFEPFWMNPEAVPG